MAAIFHPHGAKIPDIENRLKPWSQFHMNQKRDWERQWNTKLWEKYDSSGNRLETSTYHILQSKNNPLFIAKVS